METTDLPIQQLWAPVSVNHRGGDVQAAPARQANLRSPACERWNQVIDTIIDWVNGREPYGDGLVRPTRLAGQVAIEWSRDFSDEGRPAPTDAAPNGDGGIVFELHHPVGSEMLEFYDDGGIAYTHFGADGIVLLEERILPKA